MEVNRKIYPELYPDGLRPARRTRRSWRKQAIEMLSRGMKPKGVCSRLGISYAEVQAISDSMRLNKNIEKELEPLVGSEYNDISIAEANRLVVEAYNKTIRSMGVPVELLGER